MGIDLTLCPDRWIGLAQNTEWFLAHDWLGTERHYDLYEAIAALNPLPLSETIRFDWYEDDGIVRHTTDPYGTPLTYLMAGAFKRLPDTILQTLGPWNKAVITFLTLLPDQTMIVLWWH